MASVYLQPELPVWKATVPNSSYNTFLSSYSLHFAIYLGYPSDLLLF